MGKLTTLADACELNSYMMKRVGKIVIPGEILFRKTEQNQYMCCPVFEKSLKLIEDKQSSQFVIGELCRSVPFHVVNENVIQGMTITKQMIHELPGYLLTVRDTCKFLKDNNYDEFISLHKMPLNYQPATWFSHVNSVCWPYYTLMVMSFLEPELFETSTEQYGNFTNVPNITEKGREDIMEELLNLVLS